METWGAPKDPSRVVKDQARAVSKSSSSTNAPKLEEDSSSTDSSSRDHGWYPASSLPSIVPSPLIREASASECSVFFNEELGVWLMVRMNGC